MTDYVPVLVQAAALIGNAALDETTKLAVGEAWRSLIATAKQKLGPSHEAPALLSALPDASKNEDRLRALEARLAALRLSDDPDILAAIEELRARVNPEPQNRFNISIGKVSGGAGFVMGSQFNFSNRK